MARARVWLEQVARRFGGTRMLALPLLRTLSVLAGFVWALLVPAGYRTWGPVQNVLLMFFLYSVTLMAALWRWPHRVLRLNLVVLMADLAFALLLIHFTGGARSTLFLALLLIAGLQSYYFGLGHGLGVALAAAAAYLAVVWPTIDQIEWANMVIRLVMLVGTAIGVGVLAQVEESERLAVAKLTGDVQAREQFIRSVIESLGEGLVALDLRGRVIGWYRAMEERYGIAVDEVLGQTFLDRFPNYGSEGLAEPLRRLLGGESEHFTLEALTHETLRKGRVVQNLKGSLLRQSGRPAGAVLLIQDITERVALERSARQAEKLAALRVLHRHAQRVARIAQGLLSFSRQSSERRGPVDLNYLVEETLLLMEKQVVKEGIAVKRALAPDLPPVWGDGNALQQVMLNLLSNARDALPEGGEIAVETGPSPGRPGGVRLIVSDTGPGIPPDVLPKIFDPFFTTKSEGTGLGLSISYGIVRDHKGTVDGQSRPGEGTTFILTFPPLTAEVDA